MLFDPYKLKDLELPNRIARSATCDWMAGEAGFVTDEMVELYRGLAEGGVGLVISGHVCVREDGKASRGMTGGYSDEHIPGLARLAGAVHSVPGARAVAQINFGQRNAYDEAQQRHGPSAVAVGGVGEEPVPRALSTDEVVELAQAYVRTAERVKEAGFDGVQLHGAHGYMIGRFLSPASNVRDDEFGGSAEARAEFPRRIVAGVRESLGDDYPLLIKLGTHDGPGVEGGLTVEDTLQVGRWLEEWGVDAIETSGGIDSSSSRAKKDNPDDKPYFLEIAARFKAALGIPVISVGGYRSLAAMKEAVESGRADMVALCRPLIREPGLVNSFKSGEKETSDCVSCNGCLSSDGPLRCKLI